MSAQGIGCAVLGLGRLGSRHAEILATRVPGARLVAVADPIPGRAATVAEQLGTRAYLDNRDALADPAVEAVLVVTPSTTHAEVCVAAARAGKHIFCEKPLALTIAECDAIGEAVGEAGVLFQLGFMRRFDPGYARAKAQIDAGAIGKVKVYDGVSRDPGPPPLEYVRQSGGIYLDMLIHEFDLARWFMDSEVKRIYAMGKDLLGGFFAPLGDADHAYTLLEFENGNIANIEGTRNGIYGYDIRAEIMGSAGTVTVGYLKEHPIEVRTAAGVSHDVVPGFLERFDAAYTLELVEFIRCIRAGKKPSPGVWDGRQALLIALAATRSHQLGRPVDLSELDSAAS